MLARRRARVWRRAVLVSRCLRVRFSSLRQPLAVQTPRPLRCLAGVLVSSPPRPALRHHHRAVLPSSPVERIAPRGQRGGQACAASRAAARSGEARRAARVISSAPLGAGERKMTTRDTGEDASRAAIGRGIVRLESACRPRAVDKSDRLARPPPRRRCAGAKNNLWIVLDTLVL